ncbi:MAG: ATP synthase F1 subunit gamma, partial [Patescibacteria group bacterium]
RIKSVANINKITKAMELVAATKMRKSQEIALASRPYAFAAFNMLANLSLLEKDMPMLLKKRKINKTLFVLFASDKGLAGAFNSSLFRKFDSSLAEVKEGQEKLFLAIGEKSSGHLSKKNLPVVGKFTQVGDYTTTEEVKPICNFLIEGYLNKQWDKVVVYYSHFKSALKQEPMIREILPVNFDLVKKTVMEIIPETGKFAELIREHNINFIPEKSQKNYLIEPSPKKVLESLISHLIFMQVYHLILEANASEHSARRVAMKTASDNASDISGELNLQYNKSRQAAITKEIIEITAGAEALN